ncbi:MAG: hypothetical protein ABIT20_14705, partial [Gemmatimonadaceae bacterium]
LTPVLEDLARALEGAKAPVRLPDMETPLSRQPMSLIVKARVERLARQATTLHDAIGRMAPQQV